MSDEELNRNFMREDMERNKKKFRIADKDLTMDWIEKEGAWSNFGEFCEKLGHYYANYDNYYPKSDEVKDELR